MYYLVVKNFGVEKCIDINENDVYRDDQYYSCQPDLDYSKKIFKRSLWIRCTESPDTKISASVYSD
jgi:hypothetical protein